MHVSQDRKTVYYLEVTRDFHPSAQRSVRYAQMAMDVATRTAKTIDDNVGPSAVVTKNGQIVFSRSESGSTEYGTSRRLYVRDPNQSEPVLLSAKNGKDVTQFVVDENSSTVIYVDDSKIYQVPLAGGPPKKVADGWTIDAVLDQGLLVRQLFDRRNLVRFDGKKGREFKTKDEGNFVGVSSGFMITMAANPERLVLQAMPLEGKDPNAKKEIPLDRGMRSLYWGPFMRTEQIIAQYHQNNRVFRVQGADVKKTFTSTGANLGDYADLENGAKVVLACHDTHSDDNCGSFDESDICFIDRAAADEVVDIPTHTVPTPLKDVAEKLVTLTKDGDWAGARMRFSVRQDGGYQVQFESSQDGSVNVDELRARARALQTRVTELSGIPTLSVGIKFANGFTAGTLWHDGTQRFYSHGGIGQAELTDIKEYPLEIHTTIVVGLDTSICRGKLKNISDKPLEKLTVECSPEVSFGPRKAPGLGKLSPPILAPGVEGQFMTSNFDYSEFRSDDVRVVVKQGEQEILPYNRYAAKKAQERWDQAVSIYNATGLSYMGRLTRGATGAHVLASPAFQKLDKSEQEKACAKAMDEMLKLQLLDKTAVLRIQDPVTDRFRWQYKDGQLSEIVD